jgi:hypothetical protein
MTTSANGKSSTRSKKKPKTLYIYDQTKKQQQQLSSTFVKSAHGNLGIFMGNMHGLCVLRMCSVCFHTCKDCKNSIRKTISHSSFFQCHFSRPREDLSSILQSWSCFQEEQISSISSSTRSNITTLTNGFFADACKSP